MCILGSKHVSALTHGQKAGEWIALVMQWKSHLATPTHRVQVTWNKSLRAPWSKSSSLLLSVDGGWSEWTNLMECTKTCGGGTLSQSRTCTNPNPANGGEACLGDDRQMNVPCMTQECPGKLRIVLSLFSLFSQIGHFFSQTLCRPHPAGLVRSVFSVLWCVPDTRTHSCTSS